MDAVFNADRTLAHNGTGLPDADVLLQAAIAATVAAYTDAIYTPIVYTGATFQADEASQAKLNRAASRMNAGWVPAAGEDMWFDSTNAGHQMTAAFLNGLADALADRDAAMFARKQTLKAQARKAATVADLALIVW